MNFFRLHITLLLCAILLAQCKTINIFDKTPQQDALSANSLNNNAYEHTIKPDDKISLSIWNHNDISVGSSFSIYNSNEAFGKWLLVQQDSTVAFPQLGTFKIGGMTCDSAAKVLSTYFGKTLKNPIIVVKVMNKKVTVLGEVNQPGVYVLEKEQTRVAEVLGEAQGLTFYAKKSNIQLIRNNQTYTLDFTDKNALNYNVILHSGDIINVLSKNEQRIDKKAPTIIPFASLMSSLAILYSVLKN